MLFSHHWTALVHPSLLGTNRYLRCSVDSSILPVVFKWTKNSIPINAGNGRVTLSESENTSLLMFNPLHTSDGGLYQCVVTEVFRSTKITDGIELNVTGKLDTIYMCNPITIFPLFVVTASNITLSTIPTALYEYTFIDILCNVTVSEYVDTPTTIMYQWLMELTLLTSGEDYNITGDTLRINQLTRSRDNGKTITCMATVIPSLEDQYVLANNVDESIQLTVDSK